MHDDWLPPLQALRAFVVTVRSGSFAQAGKSLRLTHGAVSHHIAQLEHFVGARLFDRHRRGAKPTEEALRLADRIGRSLHDLRSACAEARTGPREILTVTMTPAFAQRWLMPRLAKFQTTHPEIDLFIRPAAATLDFDLERIDLAIRYGPGAWPGLEHLRLADETLSPMASPHFRDGRLPRTPRQLASCTLIRNPRQPWAPWFSAAGLPAVEPKAGPIIEDAGLALDLAIKGQGIVLARHVLATADLEAGRLVQLFSTTVTDAFAYHLVWRKGSTQRPSATTFKAWISTQLKSVPST